MSNEQVYIIAVAVIVAAFVRIVRPRFLQTFVRHVADVPGLCGLMPRGGWRGLIAALGRLPIHDLRNLLAAGTENMQVNEVSSRISLGASATATGRSFAA
jgi:hypothetical protein